MASIPRPALVLSLLALPPLLLVLVSASSSYNNESITVVGRIDGVVSGATADYVRMLLGYAVSRNASLVVVEVNTPGGSLEHTLQVIDYMRHSPVPVAVYVVDRWAVSAGTIILACSDIAAMEPGTIIGAVQPVILTSEGFKTVNEPKILNPVYKTIEACLKMHGRNYTIAYSFVYENKVLNADEALELGVIDHVASSIHDLVSKANNTFVERLSKRLVVGSPYALEVYSTPLGLRIARLLSDPTVGVIVSGLAMLLILLGLALGEPTIAASGIALLILGMTSLGFNSSILAIVLLLVGVTLIIIEATVIPGFSLVGATGIILLILGLIIAFSGREMFISEEATETIFKAFILTLTPLAILVGIIAYKVAEARRRKPVYTPEVVGKTGRAVDEIKPSDQGFIIVEGEYWLARNVGKTVIHVNDTVKIIGKKDAILLVEKTGEWTHIPES